MSPAEKNNGPEAAPASGEQAPTASSGTAIPLWLLAGIGLTVVVAVAGYTVIGPAYTKYLRRAKTTEAIDQIDKIYKSSALYYTTPAVTAGPAKDINCQFPASGPVPPDVLAACCTNSTDDRCNVDPALRNTQTWSSLNFQMGDEHYFVYSFDASGVVQDPGFTVSANADLDCDSVESTFQRMGFGDPQANKAECALRGSAAFYVEEETE